MKTTLSILAVITYVILLSITICNPESLLWKILLTAGLLFAGWMYIELKNAPTINDDL